MSCNGACCCFCTSSKGASFFCTSIHIFIGFYLSIKWLLVTFVNGLNNSYFEDSRMQLIYPMLLVYLSIFLVVGCINFIAVERESPAILKWSMRAFVLLQFAMLLTNILLAFAFPEHDNDLAIHRFHHIKYMLVNLIATSLYFFVIWRFVFSLENGIYVVHKKRRKKCPGTRATAGDYSPDSTRPTAPWSSDSPAATSRSQHDFREDLQRRAEIEQTLPLKSFASEPQPCSSKATNNN